MTDTAVDDALTRRAEEAMDHLNETHADAVEFVGRVLGGLPAGMPIELVAVDLEGVAVRATVDGQAVERRLAYAQPARDVDGLTPALIGLVLAARAASGEEGQTSIEREMAERVGIRTFITEVRAVSDVHAGLRRVTFGGGDLSSLVITTPDAFLYLLLPPPGRTALTIDADFSWDAVPAMAEEDRPAGAYYTAWDWRPEVAELDVLMVLHGDEGPASAWAGRAQPGDPVALWGPRSSFDPPAEARRWVLCADETGTPAACRVAAARPAGTPVLLLLEADDEAHHQPLGPLEAQVAGAGGSGGDEGAGAVEAGAVEVRWLHRDGAAPGSTTLLADALGEVGLQEGDFLWGAAEHHAVAAFRTLAADAGLPRTHRSLLAYWRR